MFCARCGARVPERASFCISCGIPLAGMFDDVAEAEDDAAEVRPGDSDAPEPDRGPAADAEVAAASARPQATTLKELLMRSHQVGRLMVPTFVLIIVSLIASVGIGVAVTVIYRHAQAPAEQAAEEHAKTKDEIIVPDESEGQENAEQGEGDEAVEDEVQNDDTAVPSDSAADDTQAEATDEQRTAYVDAPDDSAFAEADEQVPASYDPVSEVGTWTGAFVDRDTCETKSGSFEEGSWACGECFAAQKSPLKLKITSVDVTKKTASGAVSFVLHKHDGPLDADAQACTGDTYVRNISFKDVSIEGWRTNGSVEIYNAGGKSVQMALRLKYGSADDYSVWIRTVPASFDCQGLTYQWGQTDMYSISKQ